MKSISVFILSIVVLLLLGCGRETYKPAAIVLSENHMDFPETVKQKYKDIQFEISPLFLLHKKPNFVLKPYAFSRVIYELNLHLSVEFFSESEARKIQLKFEKSTDPLNAVHDYYVSKRKNSLHTPMVSIKKKNPENKSNKGLIQTIEGKTDRNGYVNTYFTSTLKIGNQYYVFQLIGKRDCMTYLYDDFESIVSSVKKI